MTDERYQKLQHKTLKTEYASFVAVSRASAPPSAPYKFSLKDNFGNK